MDVSGQGRALLGTWTITARLSRSVGRLRVSPAVKMAENPTQSACGAYSPD